MERLIADAAELTEVQKELNVTVEEGNLSFANIVNAISVMQKEMGIAGTTAKEAGSTISGSFGAMKSAWDNFLVALADGNQDAGEAFEQLKGTVGVFLDNLVPKIWAVIDSFGAFGKIVLVAAAGIATFSVALKITKGLEALKKATEATTIAQAALNYVMNLNPFVLIATLIATVVAAFVTLWNTSEGFRNAIIGAWNAIKDAFESVWIAIRDFFVKDIPQAFRDLIDWFKSIPDKFYQMGKDMFNALWDGMKYIWDEITGWIKEAWEWIVDLWNSIFGTEDNYNGRDAVKSAKDKIEADKKKLAEKKNASQKSPALNVAAGIGDATKTGVSQNAGSTTIEATVNIDASGTSASAEEIAEMVSQELQYMTDREAAAYG